MRFIFQIYKITSVLLILVELTMLFLIVVVKITRGRIIQYAEASPNNIGNEHLYPIIYYGELYIIILILTLSLLTLILLIGRELNFRSFYSKLGLAGFIFGILYMNFDPFGLHAYYED